MPPQWPPESHPPLSRRLMCNTYSYFWTHGVRVTRNHTISTCRVPSLNHQYQETERNTMGEIQEVTCPCLQTKQEQHHQMKHIIFYVSPAPTISRTAQYGRQYSNPPPQHMYAHYGPTVANVIGTNMLPQNSYSSVTAATDVAPVPSTAVSEPTENITPTPSSTTWRWGCGMIPSLPTIGMGYHLPHETSIMSEGPTSSNNTSNTKDFFSKIEEIFYSGTTSHFYQLQQLKVWKHLPVIQHSKLHYLMARISWTPYR